MKDVLLGNAKKIQRDHPIFFYRYFHDPICMLRQGDMVLLGYRKKPKQRQTIYDEYEKALFKPSNGEPEWSQWSFQKNHMDTLILQEPKYFELYNVEEDPGQYYDIAPEHYSLTQGMKKTMLEIRHEMIMEGGDWFTDN